MPKTPLLWDTAAKKEALELMQQIWRGGSPPAKEKLLAALRDGPPAHLPMQFENEKERQTSRDRRAYERGMLLLRVDTENPDENLMEFLRPLQDRYPNWRLAEGEQATFTTWMETRHGPETKHSAADLEEMNDETLVRLLTDEQNYREGLLDSWRRVVSSDAQRGLNILEALRSAPNAGRADIWRTTFWGLQQSIKDPVIRERIVRLLAQAPDELFEQSEFADSIAGVLENLIDPENPDSPTFWFIFDRTLRVAENDPENAKTPKQDRWVDLAINRSLGRLATAFFDALYAYKLGVGAGLPEHQVARFDRILGIGRNSHRLARVIAASRLPYLFAVDQIRTTQSLLPSFSWSDETEATAVWQGFCWSPTVSPDLWLAIRDDFAGALEPSRLANFGDAGRIMAQLLVMVGLEFPSEALTAEQTRAAIRSMPDNLRDDAVWWIWTYISRKDNTDGGDRPDRLWRERVQPWLKRNWPRDHALRSANLSERFSLIAISTDEAFPEAVAFFDSLFLRAQSTFGLHELEKSTHPDRHPRETLRLLTKTMTANGYWSPQELAAILQRLAAADTAIVDEPQYKEWDRQLRSRMS